MATPAQDHTSTPTSSAAQQTQSEQDAPHHDRYRRALATAHSSNLASQWRSLDRLLNREGTYDG